MAKTTSLNFSSVAEESANRGLLFQQEGKLEEAISLYRQAIAAEPKLPSVHYNLGIALHHRGDLPGANNHYREAIALNPDDIQARYNLGVVLQQQGLLESAINNYQEVINLSPPKELIKVKAYSNWGGILVGQGKFDEAREVFEKAIALKPDDATLYNNQGQAFFEAGKIEEAIAAYREALERDSELIIARHNLGKAYQKKGLHSEAIAFFQQVIERQPDNIFANSDCGFSLMEEGKLLEAVACFQRVIKNNPFVENYCDRAQELTGKDELEKAKKACAVFLEALNLHELPVGQATRESAAKQASPVGQATRESAAKQASRPSTKQKFADYLGLIYYHLGNVSFEYGEYKQAETYYKKVLKIQPLNLESYLALGKSLAKQKREKAAIIVCHWGLAIEPDNTAIAGELERLLKRKKEKDSTAIAIKNVSKLEDSRVACFAVDSRVACPTRDARPTLLKREKIECKGLNCEPCLQRIYKSFQPLHIGHNIYKFSQNNLQDKERFLGPGNNSKLDVKIVPNGRAWIVPQKNSWMICNAVAIINEENQLLAEVSREYPGQLPGCQNYDLSKHRIFNQEKLPPLEKINGTVAVLSGLSGNVYFHWMVDILPRLEILRLNGINFEEIDWFLINSYEQEFQRETLKKLGIPLDKIKTSDRHPHILANKLIVPSYPGDLGWLPKWALEFHRREFLNKVPPLSKEGLGEEKKAPIFPVTPLSKVGLGGEKTPEKVLSPICSAMKGLLGSDRQSQSRFQPSIPDTSSYPERIYISRNRARYRRVLNEEKVTSLLSKYGFATIVPESIPWEEQITLFAQAKAIVSPHGSGLTNIIFCQPGTTVIELFSLHYIRHYYWVISQELGLEHYYLKGEGFPCYPLRELMYPNPLTEDILVNLNYLEKAMEKTGIIEKVTPLSKGGLGGEQKTSQQPKIEKVPPLSKGGLGGEQKTSQQPKIEKVPPLSKGGLGGDKKTSQPLEEAKRDRTAINKNMQSQVNPTEAAAHYNDRAQLLLRQKKFDEAKAACEQALKHQPNFAPACKTMGNILQAQKDADGAWQWYSKAVEIEPDFAEAYTNMGTLYAQRQEWFEAIAYFQKAIAIKPDLAPAHRNLARAYENIGQKTAGGESFKQAVSLEAKSANNREEGREKREEETSLLSNNNNSIPTLPTDALLAYKQLGKMFQSQGKVEDAWQWYRKAIALSPNDPEIYLNLGILYAQQQQWHEAIKCYQKSLKVKPNFAESYRKLATALTQVGQQQKAAECWYRAYSIEPQKATAEEHLILGNTLLRQNSVNQAISCYCRAIELNPNLRGAYENLGEALQRQGRRYQEKDKLGWGFKEELGLQRIPQEILQKAEELKQSASNLIMHEFGGMSNSGVVKPAQISKANIVAETLKHFERVVNELVNSVAIAFNLKEDVPLSYLESSLPIRNNNYLLSKQIYYPEKPEFQVQYPPSDRVAGQPLVTVEPNLSDTYWNVGGMKSDWELGMEPEMPPQAEASDRWNLPPTNSPLSKADLPPTNSPISKGGLRGDSDNWASVKEETTINLAELHVQRAHAYFAQGVLEQAMAECERAIAMKPNLAAAYSVLGNALQQSGKLAEAEKNYRQAIALDSNDATFRANLGNLYASEQKWQQAIPCYQEAIALKPDFAGAYRNLAKAWTQVGKSAEAADCWYQAYNLEPQNVTYNQYFDLGNNLYRLGQGSQAVWCYRKAIELNPNYAPAYHNLGSTLKRQGKLDESAFYYQKAEELNGGPLVSKRKKVEVKTNDRGQQVNGSSQVKANPEDVLTSSPENNRQDADSTSPVKVGGENNESLLEKARGCLGRRQFEEAIAAGELAIKIQPQAEAYLIMGQAWQEMDRAEEAIGCYEKAIELNPKLWEAYFALGQISSSQQQWEEAIGYYRQAVELNNKSIGSYYGLGQALREKGEWGEAIACYRKVIELDGNVDGSSPEEDKIEIWEVYNNLGDGLQQVGQIEEAVEAYRRAIDLAESP